MEIRTALREFIATNFWAGEGVGDDDSLLDSGILDSTGVLEVVTFLETTFGIAVADDEIVPENLETIARMSDFVARRVEADDAGQALRNVAS